MDVFDGKVNMSTEPKISGIYKIVNTGNGKKYVGSTVNVKKRWNEHRRDLRQNKHHSPYLQRAWNKYGEDTFEFLIIEECEPVKKILIEREQFWIDTVHAYGKTGYNVAKTAGASMAGMKHTKSTLKKMRGRNWTEEQRLGISGENNHMYGRTHTPEVKEKLSELGKGKTHTEEHKEKIKGEGNPMYGKKHTEESKARMSEAQKNRPPASPETCKKISIANKGHRHTDETRKKMSDVKKERRAERLTQLPIVLANILMMLYCFSYPCNP